MPYRPAILVGLVIGMAMAACAPSTAVTPSSSAPTALPSSEVAVRSDCPPLNLRGPTGERVDLTGEWAGTGVLASDNEVALLNQIGNCVFGSVTGVDVVGDRAVTNLTGQLDADFTLNTQIAIVLQESAFGFGELTTMVMIVEWDDDGRMRLREVRDNTEVADRCVHGNFTCPAPVIWYRTDGTSSMTKARPA